LRQPSLWKLLSSCPWWEREGTIAPSRVPLLADRGKEKEGGGESAVLSTSLLEAAVFRLEKRELRLFLANRKKKKGGGKGRGPFIFWRTRSPRLEAMRKKETLSPASSPFPLPTHPRKGRRGRNGHSDSI